MSSIKRHKLHKTALFNELFQIIGGGYEYNRSSGPFTKY